MGYEIIVFGKNGETVATLESVGDDYRAARTVMSALDLYVDTDDECGPGDAVEYTAKELHAAEAALTVVPFKQDYVAHAAVLIRSAIDYIETQDDVDSVEIGFF